MTDPVSLPTMAKPLPSEWGKINSGQPYGILATDIGRALFGVPWGKYELPLLYYAMEHSWGVARTKQRGGHWPDPEPFALNINALATAWGIHRPRLYEARDRLLACRVFLEDEDGYWINKNAHEWSDPETGKPLLSDAMALYAFKARDRSHRSHKQSDVPPQRYTMYRPSGTCTDGDQTACTAPAVHDVPVQRDTMYRPSGTPHIEERAPGLDLETSRLAAQQPPTVLPATPEGPGKPEHEPPYPCDDNGLLQIRAGSHTLTDADARDIFRKLWTLSNNAKVCNGFYEDQRRHSAATWRAAIEELARRGTQPRAISYVHTIANDIEVGKVKPKPSRDDRPFNPPPARGYMPDPLDNLFIGD